MLNWVQHITLLNTCISQLKLGDISRYSASFHWLVHGHMTFNNETVSHERATLRNVKQFTVTREKLTAVARDLFSTGLTPFCYITNHFMTGPLGNSEFCFPRISVFPLPFVSGTIEILGKQNSLFPSRPGVKCFKIVNILHVAFGYRWNWLNVLSLFIYFN